METAICETCNNSFDYYPSAQAGRFCSRECIKYKANSGSFKDAGKLIDGKCVNCGKNFKYYESTKTGDYCSLECYHEQVDTSKRFPDVSGKNNPAWKGGVTKKTLRERFKFLKRGLHKKIFKKDDYTCQLCNKRGGSLHVDHIKSWSEFKGLRFDLDNCRTLCVKCHYKITFGKNMPQDSNWGGFSRIERI